MKIIGFIIGLIGLVELISPITITAQTDYVPLAPLPNITDTGKTTTSLPTYLTGIYRLGIGAAGVLAVLMLVWGGFQYMTTEAVSGKSESKGVIMNVVWGLATVLASYLLLYTINPRLVDIGLAIGKLNPVTKTRIPSAAETYGKKLDQLLADLNAVNQQPDVIAAKDAKRILIDSANELRDLDTTIADFIREHPDSVNDDNPDHPELESYKKRRQEILDAQRTLKTKAAAATIAAKSEEIKGFKVKYLEDEDSSRITGLQESIKKSAAELRSNGKETEAKKIEDDSAKAIDEVKKYFQCYKGLIAAHAQGAITESERIEKCKKYSTGQIASYQ